MNTTENNHEAENTIVKFHIGRGGRFNNAWHLSFDSISRIDEGDAYNSLFLNEESGEYYDESGNKVGLTVEEANTGIGSIDIDGEYDTTYTKYLNDCTKSEISAIWDNEYGYDDLLSRLNIEDFEILRAFNISSENVFYSDDLSNTCTAFENGIEEIDEETYFESEYGYDYNEVNGKYYRKEEETL